VHVVPPKKYEMVAEECVYGKIIDIISALVILQRYTQLNWSHRVFSVAGYCCLHLMQLHNSVQKVALVTQFVKPSLLISSFIFCFIWCYVSQESINLNNNCLMSFLIIKHKILLGLKAHHNYC